MEYNLFLDDFREPYDAYIYTLNPIYSNATWIVVRNYEDFCNYIKENGLPNIVSFDHDLADTHYNQDNQTGKLDYDSFKEKTGYHCAKWMTDYMLDNNIYELPICYVHSMNPVGRENIISLLRTFDKVINKK